MLEALEIVSTVIPENQILWLLNRYQLMPQLLQNIVIDKAIANFFCTEQERQLAIEKFCQQHQILSLEAQENWALANGITQKQIEEIAIRPVLIEKFKQAAWGSKVESYFINYKHKFDQVVYSLIRTKDYGIAQEIYFRIQANEQSFSELAQEYSTGPEAYTGGVSGPVALGRTHPTIAKILSHSQPGQLWPPIKLEEWFLIIRLEKVFPAQLDETIRRYIIDELFKNWLQNQMQQVEPLEILQELSANNNVPCYTMQLS